MKKMKSTKSALFASVISLLLCCSMLVGTTFAWFTDKVVSENNIIKTGKLDVEMSWADGSLDPNADTTEWKDASSGPIFDYANWEPGYAVARHLKITNAGTLALNYQMRIVANGVVSELADVIDVYYFAEDEALERGDIADAEYLGTLTEVLGTQKNIAKKINGSLEAGDPSDIHTIVLKMNEEAGNEYQNMDLGCTFSVELIASQMTAESDSFDDQYDAEAPNPAVPAALVRPLKDLSVQVGIHTDYGDLDGNLLLDTGYKFEPTLGRPEDVLESLLNENHLPYNPDYSVEDSAYRYWHADFVVKADKDVPASSLALAGYYSLFCDLANEGKWIALSHDDVIPAGTEVRLVSAMADGAGMNITVSWNDLCAYGNDGLGFMCGAVDLTGENIGTTLTVELRLYPVPAKGECDEGGGCTHPYEECETNGDYITVGKFDYTFGVNNATKLQYALQNGGEITLTDDITLTSQLNVTADTVIDGQGYTLTYTGSGNRVIDVANTTTATLTVKDLTIDINNSYCQRAINYNVPNGELVLDNVKLTGNTKATYGINLPGSSDNVTVTITDCDIIGNTALNVWGENSVITVTNSKLSNYDPTEVENYAAISLNADNAGNSSKGTVLTVTNCTIIANDENGDPCHAVTTMADVTVVIDNNTKVIGNMAAPVALIRYQDGNGGYYAEFYASFTMQSAVSRASESTNAVIVLMDNVTVDTLNVPTDVVINLNGYTLTVGSYTGEGQITYVN